MEVGVGLKISRVEKMEWPAYVGRCKGGLALRGRRANRSSPGRVACWMPPLYAGVRQIRVGPKA